MTNEELVQKILGNLGGKANVVSATNCMTRLRINVKDDAQIQEEELKEIEGVMGVVHDRSGYLEVVVGPGKCRKCADICSDMGIPSTAAVTSTSNDWKTNKAAVKSQQKTNPVRNALKIFGEIFVPLIPGVVAAGLCSGISTLIQQLNPGCVDNGGFLAIVVSLLGLISSSFMAYLTAWAGYRAAERFGGTPILGGMLGMITGLDGINAISAVVGWFNADSPLDSLLRSGRGGVLSAVLGVFIMCKVEKWIRKRMPDALDIILTPLLTLIICVIPYIFIIMPLCGLVSTGLVWCVQQICMSPYLIVRCLAGFISSALFLPMVAMGMHHGLVALYTVQLNTLGYVTLYPALCMAGAGQVGAAIAIYLKAKRVNNTRMKAVIGGALPAGILGVGEPLIYGVTLPMGKPFITAGLGAGFGGAFVMAMQVAATTWGPSGLLGCFVMTAGPNSAVMSILYYAIGIVISYIMGFIITKAVVKDADVANA
ncbi:MAG: PTS transporter subunit EIIC [Lachnospiraceae bacterium]|nr:PTS transporter subunit EIIC [Lachnospiraceae bacterium]